MVDKSWFSMFLIDVLKEERLSDWNYRVLSFEDGDACYSDLKLLEFSQSICNTSWFYQKERILHEVAHAINETNRSNRTSWKSHDKHFLSTFGQLLIKYADNQPEKIEGET